MSFDLKKALPILLIVLYLMQIVSCSKRIYPETSSEQPKSSAEKKRLNEFLKTGTGKALATGSVTPDEIIKTSRQYLGVPHCMGGTTKKCIDCSGLLTVVFASHGIELPHNSEEQSRYGKVIENRNDLRKGDLVFFIRTYSTSRYITHSGICIGNNQFIHTSSSKGVTITSLSDPWWNDKFSFGTRILR